jgi:polysaccharide export outer membrane protein
MPQMKTRFLISCLVIAVSLSHFEVCFAQAPADTYQIGPNDVLNVHVWKEPELSRDITVMSDGRITFPLIGEIMAKDLSVNELKEIMLERLAKFIDAPEITVIVKESKSKVIYVIGKVTNPGPYPLTPEMTVLQGLATAGGFNEWSDKKNIVIVRRNGGKEVKLPFNYKEFLGGKNTGQNVLLKPGDTIVVP